MDDNIMNNILLTIFSKWRKRSREKSKMGKKRRKMKKERFSTRKSILRFKGKCRAAFNSQHRLCPARQTPKITIH